MKKRILSLALVLCMLLSTMSAYAVTVVPGTRTEAYETVHSVTIDETERVAAAGTGLRQRTERTTPEQAVKKDGALNIVEKDGKLYDANNKDALVAKYPDENGTIYCRIHGDGRWKWAWEENSPEKMSWIPAITYIDEGLANGSMLYSGGDNNAEGKTLIHLSPYLQGTSQIIVPYHDYSAPVLYGTSSRGSEGAWYRKLSFPDAYEWYVGKARGEDEEYDYTGENVYFTFTPDADGTLYILDYDYASADKSVYMENDFEKIDGNNAVPEAFDETTADAAAYPEGVQFYATRKRVDSKGVTTYLPMSKAYMYKFSAGETVTVPTPHATSEPPAYLIKWDDRLTEDEKAGRSNTAISSLSYALDGGEAIAIDVVEGQTEYEVAVDPTAAITLAGVAVSADATVISSTDATAVKIPFNTDLSLAKVSATVEIEAYYGDSQTYTVTFVPKLEANHIYNLDVENAGQYGAGGSSNASWDTSKTYTTYYEGSVSLYGGASDMNYWYDTFYTTDGVKTDWSEVSVVEKLTLGTTAISPDRSSPPVVNAGSTNALFAGQTILRRARNEFYGNTRRRWKYDTENTKWIYETTVANGQTIDYGIAESGNKFFCEDYSGQNGAEYWYTFYISSPARVYYDTQLLDGSWQYGEADGWTKDTNMKVNGRATYYKDFEAGMVGIPNANGDIHDDYKEGGSKYLGNHYIHETGAYYIIWDSNVASKKSQLSSLTYSADGGEAMNVTGWTANDKGNKTYTVTLPKNTKSVTLNAAPLEADATIEGASQTVDITTGYGSAVVKVTTTLEASTYTINFENEGAHKVEITYTDDRKTGLTGITTAVQMNSDVPAAGWNKIGAENPFSTQYAYVDNGLTNGDKPTNDRNYWNVGHLSDKIYGMSYIQTSVDEVRLIHAGEFERGVVETGGRRKISTENGQKWFKSADGVYFEITPDADATLYILTSSAAPNYANAEKGFVQVEAGGEPSEFDAYKKYNTESNKSLYKKYMPYDTVVRSKDYYTTIVQWTEGNPDRTQFSNEEQTAITGIHKHLTSYGYVYKVRLTKDTKFSVPVPGDLLSDPALFLIEWDDKKIPDATLSSLTYTIDGANATAVDGFEASDESGVYTVKVPYETSEVALSATAGEGIVLEGAGTAVLDAEGKASITITATSGMKVEAYTVNFEKLPPQVKLSVSVEGNGTVMAGGSLVADEKSYDINTVLELVASPKDENTSKFAYWQDNNSGRIVSEEAEYKITLVSDKKISAVFSEISDATKTVVFKNKNGQILKRETVTESKSVTVPENNPYYMGYNFVGWKLNGEGDVLTELAEVAWADVKDLEGAMVVYEAYFEKGTGKYALTLINATATPKGEGDNNNMYAYDKKITVTGNGTDGTNTIFSHWIKDDEIVSYDDTYSFFMSASPTTVEAKYVADEADKAVKAPVVIMTNPVVLTGQNRIAFFAERNLYADEDNSREFIEAGIIINMAKADFDMKTPGTLKATSTSTNGRGQFTVRKAGLVAGNTVYAKAYMTYKEGDVITTVFSNVVEGTYN